MPSITYVEFDGTEHQVNAELGVSIMQNALNNGVPGIEADCGGECSCATCHIILSDDWFYRLGELSENEESMLGLNPERTELSRLSCQIPVSEEMEGLVVTLPEFQF